MTGWAASAMAAFLGSVDLVLLREAVHPLVGDGVPLVADKAVDVDRGKLLLDLVLFFRTGVLVAVFDRHTSRSPWPHRPWLRQACGRWHLVQIIRCLTFTSSGFFTPEYFQLMRPTFDRCLDGQSGPSGAENGPGMERLVPLVVNRFMALLAAAGIVHLCQFIDACWLSALPQLPHSGAAKRRAWQTANAVTVLKPS